MRYWWVLVAAAACGGSQQRATDNERQFFCRDRSVSYIATGHIGGDEIGVMMSCENGPRIKRWRTDKQGKRDEDDHPISPVEFDRTWKEINGTGWEHLRDCSNGSLEKGDPVYVFDVKDDQNKATFQCQTREVPYPYNDLIDPLDVLAQKGRGQLGDDEPADAKALDHKDKQK